MNLFRIFRMPCVFHLLTGYYCLGCGGTRAVRALLHGEILKSLYYHPLVLYMAVIAVWYLVSLVISKWKKQKKAVYLHRWMIVLGVVITLGNWIWKNVVLFVWHIALI